MIRMINSTSVRLIAVLLVVGVAFHNGLSQEFSAAPSPTEARAKLFGEQGDKTSASAPAVEGSKLAEVPGYAELQKQIEDLQNQFAELFKQAGLAKEKLGQMKDLFQKYHDDSMKAAAAASNFDADRIQTLQKENASLREEMEKLKISNDSLGKTNLKYQTDIAVLEDKVRKLQDSIILPHVATRPAYTPPELPSIPSDNLPSVATGPSTATQPFMPPAVALDKPIRSKIVAIDRDIAVIDAGASAGVKEKARLYIVRDGKVIATLKIMNVGDMSSGIVEDKKQNVKVDDLVVSEIPAQ